MPIQFDFTILYVITIIVATTTTTTTTVALILTITFTSFTTITIISTSSSGISSCIISAIVLRMIHINNTIESSRNTILLTGYCEPRSLGGKLLRGLKEVKIFGVEKQVNAEVGQIRSMSAHGDYDDMCQWLACQDPQQVEKLFIVHGEYDVQQSFRDRLIRKGFTDVIIPELHFETGI